MYVLAIYI